MKSIILTAAALVAASGVSAQVDPKIYDTSIDAFTSNGTQIAQLGGGFNTGGFEAPGYAVGPISGQAGWTIFANNTPSTSSISTANPASGSQHLRLSQDSAIANGSLVGGFSPLFGDVGEDIVMTSVDVFIDAAGGSDYDVVPQAPSQNFLSARVKFSFLGDILILDDVGAGLAFIDSGLDWVPGSYQNLTISMDRANNTIDYSYGGNQFYSSVSGIFAGTAIEQVVLLHDNFSVGENGDFDNLTVGAIPAPASAVLLGFGGMAAARRRR
ncbi:MAG: hypothetical protein Phyf2KO_13600 [Phycisphaerales bacterium]